MADSRNTFIIDAQNVMHGARMLNLHQMDMHKLKTHIQNRVGEALNIKNFHFHRSFYFAGIRQNITEEGRVALERYNSFLKKNEPFGPGYIIKSYPNKTKNVNIADAEGNAAVTRVEVQLGVDVGIATEMVIGAAENRYDVLVLASGDGDYEDAIRYAMEKNKTIILVGFEGTISPRIQCYASHVLTLGENDIKKLRRDWR